VSDDDEWREILWLQSDVTFRRTFVLIAKASPGSSGYRGFLTQFSQGPAAPHKLITWLITCLWDHMSIYSSASSADASHLSVSSLLFQFEPLTNCFQDRFPGFPHPCIFHWFWVLWTRHWLLEHWTWSSTHGIELSIAYFLWLRWTSGKHCHCLGILCWE